MQKIRPITFAEFRAFLQRLGYVEQRVPKGRVFQHPDEGRLLYRFYEDDDAVLPRDLQRTRTFFDYRGLISAEDFDAALLRADTPA
jgi:hypothetical protein